MRFLHLIVSMRADLFHFKLVCTVFSVLGIPGVTKEAVTYVNDRLLLDLSEEEAAARFGQLIHESINSSLSTQVTLRL